MRYGYLVVIFSKFLVAHVLILFVIFVAPNIYNKFLQLIYNYMKEKVVASVRKHVELLSPIIPPNPNFYLEINLKSNIRQLSFVEYGALSGGYMCY